MRVFFTHTGTIEQFDTRKSLENAIRYIAVYVGLKEVTGARVHWMLSIGVSSFLDLLNAFFTPGF